MERRKDENKVFTIMSLFTALLGCKNPERVTPVIEVSGVALDRYTLTLAINRTVSLVATVSPKDAENVNVSWSSDQPQVVSVSDNGLVTGLSAGTAIVTVSTENNSYRASCTVTVLDAYTLSFDTGEGTSVSYQVIQEGERATQPDDPTRTGYSFEGWYSDNSYTTLFDFSTKITSDMALYARWDLVNYSIEYTVHSSTYTGTNPVSSSNPYSFTIESDTLVLTDPQCNNLYFLGWFTDETYTQQIQSIPAGSTGDLHLYAKWTTIIQVTLDPNGGSGSPESVSAPAGNSFTLAENPFTAPSSELGFAGWATSSSATDPEYAAGESFTTGTSDITLYAVWKNMYVYSLIESDTEVAITAFSEYFDKSADVTIPSEIDGLPVTSLGLKDSASENKMAVIHLVVPDSVETLIFKAFYGLKAMESLVLGNGLNNIDMYVAYYCSSLSSVTLPDSLTSIPAQMFAGCGSLKSIDLPSSLERIGLRSFLNCGLESIVIPASVEEISINGAFEGCRFLSSIQVESGNQDYMAVDNVLFTMDGTSLLVYASARAGTSYTVPEGVITLGQGAFEKCSGLTEMNLPSTLQNMFYSNTFSGSSITSLVIPDGVTKLGLSAFSACGQLTSVTLPNNLATIGRSCFLYCYDLESLTLPSTVTQIDDYAFKDLRSLSEFICEASTPPSLDDSISNLFGGETPSDLPIQVPCTLSQGAFFPTRPPVRLFPESLY